jgi:mitochondrial fission protein ELM1
MHSEADRRPLAGKLGWVITDDKIGMIVQCRGVADALGLAYHHKRVNPAGLRRLLAPWMSPRRSERSGRPGTLLAPPWPSVAIATGRLSIPYIRALARLAGPATFTVVLQDPKTGVGTADVICVPEHDRLRGANVVTTLTAPHSFSPARLSQLRCRVPPEIAALPAPRVTVVLGGPSGTYRFTGADQRRLAGALASLAALDVSFLITPSRRTPKDLLQSVDEVTRRRPRLLWRGEGDNPYPSFLAHADLLIVTADSVNMTGEACATGRPVYVFKPTGGSPKLARFHAALMRHGATRVMPEHLSRLEVWSYAALDAASELAGQIERRWARRQAEQGAQPGPSSGP